jgi:hypothetical protein
VVVAESWARRGVTLLWGAEELRDIASAAEVRPLRSLFAGRSDWPEQLPSNAGRALVAAGLEATLDCLSPADAEQWLEQDLRDLILAHLIHRTGRPPYHYGLTTRTRTPRLRRA